MFALALALYLRTLATSVAGGDSGELAAAACALGVAHPPGYPLYTLVAHLFTLLPWASPAWRVGLASAIADAGAAAIVASIVQWSTASRGAAVVAGVAFATAPLVWSTAVVPEVFALNNLLVASLLALAWRWQHRPSRRRALGCSFVAGLALANHHTSLFVVLPLLLWMAALDRGLRAPRALMAMAAAFAAGLLPYAWIWLASRAPVFTSWGDASTLQGFLDLLLRREYGSLRLGGEGVGGQASWLAHVAAFVRALARNLAWLGLLPMLAGLFAWRDRFAVLLAACFFAYVVVFHSMTNLPIAQPLFLAVTERFWQQPLLIACLWLGAGLARGEVVVARHAGRPGGRALLAGMGMVLLVAAAQRWPQLDRRDAGAVDAFGHALLEPLPKDALLLVSGDLVSNSLRYLQVCEGRRPDVVVLDQELLTREWYTRRVRERWPELLPPGVAYDPRVATHYDIASLLARNGARSLFVYPAFKQGDDSWKRDWQRVPCGFAGCVQRAGAAPTVAWTSVASGAGFLVLREREWPDAGRWPEGSWDRAVLDDFRMALAERGQWLLDHAGDAPSLREGLETAERALREAASRWQPSPWFVDKNLGLASMRLSKFDDGAGRRAVDAWARYLETAPPDEKDRDRIRDWVEKETQVAPQP